MDARRYLEELKIQKHTLLQKKEALDLDMELFSRTGCLDKDMGFIQKDRNVHAYEDTLHRLLNRKEELIAETRRYLQDSHVAEDRILKIKPHTASLVIGMRYLLELDWDEIAKRLNYSKTHVYRYHRLGLMDLDIQLSADS